MEATILSIILEELEEIAPEKRTLELLDVCERIAKRCYNEAVDDCVDKGEALYRTIYARGEEGEKYLSICSGETGKPLLNKESFYKLKK